MATGAHTIGASATDAAGHVSTTSASITYSLPALSDFRPEVTPKNLSMDVFTGISAQRTFTVRNAGVANASYQLAPVCPSVACQISKTSTTLDVGATDSAVVTFTPTSSMGPSAIIGLRATYTDAASHAIADTGSVVATLAQMASHAVPSLTPLAPTMTVEPGVTTTYYFVLRNTGTLAATYDFSSVTAGGFSWPQGWAVFDARQSRARASERARSRARTIGADLRDAGESDDAERLGSNHAHRNLPCVGRFGVERQRIDPGLHKSPDRGIGITPSVSVPLTVSVDRAVAYHEVAFTVINTGVMSGSYQYSSACHGFAQNCRLANGPHPSPFVLAAGATANVTIGYDATGVDNGAGFNFIELFGTQVETGRQAVGTILLSSSASPTVAASVTPANDQVSPSAHSAQSVTFTITNIGGVAASFSFAVACSGAVTSCASSAGLTGSTSSLASGAQSQVVVTYQSGDAGSVGTVSLNVRSADGVGERHRDSHRVRARIDDACRARALREPRRQRVARTVPHHFRRHGRRVRMWRPASRAPAAATTTMGKARAPTLFFSSDQARPGGVIAAEVTVPASVTANVVRATVTFPAKSAVTVQRDFAWSGALSDSRPRRIAVRFEAPDWETGAYTYVFQVQAMSGSTVLAVARDTGIVAVVNRVNSPFGRGWWLDGLEQISITTPDSSQRLWVGGDGSTRLYSKVAEQRRRQVGRHAVARPAGHALSHRRRLQAPSA